MEGCCKRNCSSIPRIVRGNDFTMMIDVKRPVVNTIEDFDLASCRDIEITLVSRYGRRQQMGYKVVDGKLRVDFDETLPSGVYGMIIKGKDKNGQDWRFFAKPGEWIEIVDASSDEYDPEISNGYYDKTVTFGIAARGGSGGGSGDSDITNLSDEDIESLIKDVEGSSSAGDTPSWSDDEPLTDEDITGIIDDVENGDDGK